MTGATGMYGDNSGYHGIVRDSHFQSHKTTEKSFYLCRAFPKGMPREGPSRKKIMHYELTIKN